MTSLSLMMYANNRGRSTVSSLSSIKGSLCIKIEIVIVDKKIVVESIIYENVRSLFEIHLPFKFDIFEYFENT